MAFWRDLRIGTRAWRRTPVAGLTIVLTLAVGIGLNTAIFSLVHAALLRPLPYRDSAALVSLSGVNLATGDRDKVTGADLVDWRTRSRTVAEFATYWDTAFTIPSEVPITLPAWEVSSNLFTMLGTQAFLGRTLVADDGLAARDRVIVLSHRTWLQQYGGDKGIIGRRIVLRRSDGVEPAETSYAIVGVMPPTFAHPNPTAALWTILRADLSQNRRLPIFQVIGRLHAGVSVARADEELKAIAAALASQYPQTNARRSAAVREIRSIYTRDVALSLWILQGTALVLLLIACTNVTTLLLARAVIRDKEVALRLAIGATRAQIIRQSAADALLLSCTGAMLGVLLAYWGVGLLPRLLESQLAGVLLPEPSSLIATSDLAAVAALTVLISLALAFIPVVARRSALSLIGDTSRASTAPRGVLRVRAGFIVAQMALSLCLLIAAGLLVRSFVRLQERPLGFRTGNVLSGSLTLTTDRYRDLAQRELFLQELTTRLRALPDVEGAAAISTLPLSGADARRPYQIPGQTTSEVQWTQFRIVTPQYFDVMDIPLRRGRRFDDRDRAGSTQVAIINERLARTLWPAEDPIGKIMLVPDVAPPAQAREIIGVVGDVRHNGLTADIPLELYRPASQTTWPFFSVVVRTTGEPERLIPSVRAAVAAIDRTITIGNSLRPLDQLAADSIGTRQVTMTLVSVFAVTALTLALVGVYGLVAYLVAQRTREFGVRLALGARQAHIHATVFRQVLAPVIVGLVVGIAAALAGAGLLQSQLFEVAPHDPLTFVIVAVAFLGTGVLAMLVPARRAAVLDPVTALRRD